MKDIEVVGEQVDSGAQRPIIIIGAARSGTNMIRDVLTELPMFDTWPCDEINYIWRRGNVRHSDDEFTPAMAHPKAVSFIRRAFERRQAAQKGSRLIEKTCANSLRVGFVDRIFPEAVYIFIVRDGRDASLSAANRWRAKLDLGYIAKKARYVPIRDVPYYAVRYLFMRVKRKMQADGRIGSWGPRFKGIDNTFQEKPLHVACAIQWAECVEKAEEFFSTIDGSRVIRITYEKFVNAPAEELQNIMDFLGEAPGKETIQAAVDQVRTGSVGRWKGRFGETEVGEIESAVGETLKKFGY